MKPWLVVALIVGAEVIAIVAFVKGYDAGWRTRREPDPCPEPDELAEPWGDL